MLTKTIHKICYFFGYMKPKIVKQNKHNINIDNISTNAIKVCETLQKAGFVSYIVGGAIRDLIVGLKPKDFDIATNASPEEVRSLFRRAYIIGKRFRIVHVIMGKELIEISTFRSPPLEKDEFGRILKDNSFGSHQEDASRRDFTINSLYYNPMKQEIIDYYSGLKDLKYKRIRIIGNAGERYREDPVRMLRAIRLSTKINGTLEKNTNIEIDALKDLIVNIPQARLFDEIIKILTCGNSFSCLEQLHAKNILHNLIPSLNKTFTNKKDINFLKIALNNTDYRLSTNKSISPGFLLAIILWEPTKSLWKELLSKQNNSFLSMDQASEKILLEQSKTLKIHKRITIDAKDIWLMQAKLEAKNIKNYYKIIEHAKFRAAFDFMQLRAESKEIDNGLSNWWVDFYKADDDLKNR
ncbi:poly(A) polymerase [Candidatus Kinetoplastibacterium crithidii TCC036E]|uniref:Poly(A) polymerase I n=2 Tax=Candidatus Kinetoplastidibacterium crithidiae TaxID=33056 RepID=M1LQG9_9PROT|nr:poly(A) polymerase [Candidatus Kinetoplastibacterium crithidii TCC036E]